MRSRVDLTPAQQFAAYASGQNDAALNLAKEKTAASYAKTAGSDSGLVYDNFVREAIESGRSLAPGGNTYLTAETAERVNAVSKALGLRAQFAGSVEGGLANASISGNTVLIEQNNPNPVTFLFGHEITHRMQELAPPQYHSFVDFISRNDGDFQTQVEAVRDLYANNGREISYEGAVDEAAADYAGRLMEDGRLLDDFIQKNRKDRTLLEKLRDAFRSLISKLTGADKRRAQTAEGKLTAALEAAAKQAESLQTNQNAAQTDGESKFSIKRTSQMTLSEQLKMFYDGKMASSDAFYFGETPNTLNIAGLDTLPLAFTVSDFRKSSKAKHNVPRRVWNNLHNNLESALFSFRQGDRIGIMTGDIDGDGKPLLVGIERNVKMNNTYVNAIRSAYGLDNPGPWLRNQIKAGKEFVLLNKEKANAFLHTYDAYLASEGDSIRFMDESITENGADVKTKFSLKSPVEETKDLIAVHNVSEQGLLGALELGGLPSPSIAITKADMGHTKYGDISLVFSKDTVDPQLFRSNKVYGSDAWTPTAPTVEYPVNSKKLFSVERDLHRLAGSTDVAGGIFGNSSVLRSMGLDDTSTKSAAELAEAISQTDTGRAAYMADQGKALEPVKKTRVWDRYGNDSLRSFVDQVGPQRLAKMVVALELGKDSQTALGQDAETLDGILRDYYKQSGEAMLQRMAVRKKWTAQEIKEQRQARIDRAMENVATFAKEDVVRHAWQMFWTG